MCGSSFNKIRILTVLLPHLISCAKDLVAVLAGDDIHIFGDSVLGESMVVHAARLSELQTAFETLRRVTVSQVLRQRFAI